MSQLIFGGLLSKPAPTAPIIGIAFIVLFAIVVVIVDPDYDGINFPALKTQKRKMDIEVYSYRWLIDVIVY
jgi:hypothetical protein